MPQAFHPARLVGRWPAAHELEGLRLAAPEVANSYQVPGQYLQVRTPDGAVAYLALASPPGHQPWELLVRPAAATEALLALPVGAAVEVSPALGAGYPVAAHRGQDLLLFAVGSGIAPIRSLIGYLAEHRNQYASITLFYGARTRAHMPFEEELPDWEAAGIEVVRSLSQPADEPGFARGYVQAALAAHPVIPAQAAAFVCGMPAMAEGVSAALTARGVSAERIYQNY